MPSRLATASAIAFAPPVNKTTWMPMSVSALTAGAEVQGCNRAPTARRGHRSPANRSSIPRMVRREEREIRKGRTPAEMGESDAGEGENQPGRVRPQTELPRFEEGKSVRR